ncbi:MAG: cobalamin B12-binding domain-containing protein [Dehalococcoidia bacterium]
MNAAGNKPRILISKVGHDGHDRGAKVLATMLRDAGMEVIYLGAHQAPEAVIVTALQEDVDIVGISYLGGDHLKYTPKLLKLMKEKGLGARPLIVGGIIPRQDIPLLKEQGVAEVFVPGMPFSQIVDFINEKTSAK